MNKVVLAGYYGFGNVGDEALLEVLVSNIKELNPDIKITILANQPKDVQKRLKTEAVNRSNLFHIVGAFYGADKVIFGGGGLFQDITSFRSLIYYLALIVIARVMKVKVYLIAQGIGPLKRKISKRLVQLIFKFIQEVSVRDEKSLEILRQLYSKKIVLTYDPALLLSSNKEVAINEDIKKVIISIRGFPDLTRSKKDIIVQVLKKLIKEEDIKIVFLPFHGEEDKKACIEILNMLDGHGKLEEPQTTPLYLLRIMEGTYVVIGMRLHSLIFAAGLGIPFVGLAYDQKVTSFCESYKMPVLELENLNPFDLEKDIKEVLSLRQRYAKRIMEVCKQQRENINSYLINVLKG